MSRWCCYNFEQLATGGRSRIYRTPQPPVGASLLAIAVDQSTVMLDLMQPSRASSLPQGGSGYLEVLCSRQARRQYRPAFAMNQEVRAIAQRNEAKAPIPVSYTHLTLPTIYSV